MFVDLSWSHILLVLVIALVVVGPKDLPKLMRVMGQWAAKARSMADQFRKSFDEMARQTELDELRKEIEALRNVRPLADLEQSIIPPDLMSLPPMGGAAEAFAAAEVAEEAAKVESAQASTVEDSAPVIGQTPPAP